MRALLRLIAAMTRTERIVLGGLALILLASFALLLRSFYLDNTERKAVPGGTYIEGSVGDIQPLNPWFNIRNDVNRDVLALVFAGLLKYDPQTGKIIDDLATLKVSADNRIYTLTLKNNLHWHDSSVEKPHTVTTDDILFTFKTIQDKDFPNPILHQNFRGVEVEKLDDRSVRFRLSKPYSFFASNLTLGLLPAASFEGVPVAKLDQALDFGFHPIGAGPYSFVSLIQTELSTEVTLRRFERPGISGGHIDRVVLRVFPDYSTLLSDITNMNGVRLVPRNDEGQPIVPKKFRAIPYILPQYVGLFYNLDRPVLADRNLRLGLQLATNKQEIVDTLHETQIVDTPLLEIDYGDWRYKFDLASAQGALFESDWNMPEKLRLQRLLEQRDATSIGPLKSLPQVALLLTGSTLTLTGTVKDTKAPLFINGIRVETGAALGARAGTGAWMVKLPAGNGSGGLRIGMNIIKMTNAKDDIVDTAYVERVTDSRIASRAAVEQQLIREFITGKQFAPDDPKRVTIEDLYLDSGYLRRRTQNDEPHTRVNLRGNPLKLTLLTSRTPDDYPKIAKLIAKQWQAVGVEVRVDVPEDKKEFQQRMLQRDYDVLLFGQSLLDNLDSYPYWHSSQVQEKGEAKNLRLDAFNLSQYASFEADTLLQRIRETSNADSRAAALEELNDIFKHDVPAVFLYSPLSVFAIDQSVQGAALGKLTLHSDRFLGLSSWYISTKREFRPGRSWLSFPGWLLRL